MSLYVITPDVGYRPVDQPVSMIILASSTISGDEYNVTIRH
jgi:hypothetical protein